MHKTCIMQRYEILMSIRGPHVRATCMHYASMHYASIRGPHGEGGNRLVRLQRFCPHIYIHMHYASIRGPHVTESMYTYGVAMIRRLLKNMGRFADYILFYRALLQRRPLFLGSLLIAATSYQKRYIYIRTSTLDVSLFHLHK